MPLGKISRLLDLFLRKKKKKKQTGQLNQDFLQFNIKKKIIILNFQGQ